MNPLRVVFMGTPDFAVASLAAIHESDHEVAAVVTAPDKPAGRGQQVRESVVKQFATKNELPVLQPPNLKSDDFQIQLKKLDADLFVVVAFRMLPESVWALPPKGTVNLHASLLPQYRGAAPINWAIMNGETSTGVTTFFIKKEIDTGDLLLQKSVAIETHDTAGTLHDKLMHSGAELLVETITRIADKAIQAQPQNTNQELKEAPKIYREDCRIDWNSEADNICNRIRGLDPYPGAWSVLCNDSGEEMEVKLFSALPADDCCEVGAIELSNGLQVGTGSGSVIVGELQPAGKRRMTATAFLNGTPVNTKWRFK